MKCVDEAQISSNTLALVRCDLDVAMTEGVVEEPYRLNASLETLNYIIKKGGTPIICGHMGRPKGQFDPKLSTSQLKYYFDANLKGKYELMENLRFNPKEELNDPEFAKELAQKADIYVNESFATCHRESASNTGVAKLLPAYAGFQLVREVNSLTKVLQDPKRPLVAIIGGAKQESKRPVINKFAEIADAVLVGGRLALEEPINMEKVHCPIDYIDQKDIGPKTLSVWQELIINAKTIVWAGPVGMFENENYANGTKQVGAFIVKAIENGCFAVAGGGDTASALSKFGIFNKFSFVSTGGGAMLSFLVEGTLPGIKALE